MAGPLQASRVLLDKAFNPHLFVRLISMEAQSQQLQNSLDAPPRRRTWTSARVQAMGASTRHTAGSVGPNSCGAAEAIAVPPSGGEGLPHPFAQHLNSMDSSSMDAEAMDAGRAQGDDVGLGGVSPHPGAAGPGAAAYTRESDVADFGRLLVAIFAPAAANSSSHLGNKLRGGPEAHGPEPLPGVLMEDAGSVADTPLAPPGWRPRTRSRLG